MRKDVKRIFKGVVDAEIRKSPEFKTLTTIGTGGKAGALVYPKNLRGLSSVLKRLTHEGVGYFIFGRGSNILVPDGGVDKVALGIGEHITNVQFNGNGVIVGAGSSLPRLAVLCAISGRCGLEEFSGIPGTVGGALIMNAGSYGREIGEFLEWVEIVDESGEAHRVSGSQIEFGYRYAHFPVNGVVYRARLELAGGDSEDIFSRMKDLNGRRRLDQPWGEKTFGSVFKNPPGMSAGMIIEGAGLKGFGVGDARISEKHANFIVNRGKAKTGDVLRLMDKVRHVVFEKRLIILDPEVRYIG